MTPPTPDTMTAEIRPLTDDELAEVFAILRNQDAILGTRLVDCLRATIEADRRRLEAYDELIYAVATKHWGETRHQTALRYIQEAENRPSGGPVTALAAKEKP